MKTPELTWETIPQGGGHALSGSVTIASWGRVQCGESIGRWWYAVDGIRTRWISKGHGHVSSEQAAKAAIRRAWAAWCRAAGISVVEAAS